MVKANIRWIDMKEIMNPTKEQQIQQVQQVQPQVQPVQPIVQSVQPVQPIVQPVQPIERQRIKAEQINLSYPEIEKPEEKPEEEPEEPEETYTVNNRLEEITAPYRYKLEQMRQSRMQPVKKQRKFNFETKSFFDINEINPMYIIAGLGVALMYYYK